MFIKYKCVVLSLKQNVIFKPHLDLAFSSPQLLQTSPILCSTWTTTSSIGKAWMRGSCTACDHLPSRCCSVCALGLCNLRQTSSLSLSWLGGVSLPASPASQGASSPSLSCFRSTPSVHMSVHTENHRRTSFLTGSCSCNAAGFTSLSYANCDKQTRTRSILTNFLCLSGNHSVAGQVT